MTVQEGIREQSVGIASNQVLRLGARQLADLRIQRIPVNSTRYMAHYSQQHCASQLPDFVHVDTSSMIRWQLANPRFDLQSHARRPEIEHVDQLRSGICILQIIKA
jgi:hypothetical protein